MLATYIKTKLWSTVGIFLQRFIGTQSACSPKIHWMNCPALPVLVHSPWMIHWITVMFLQCVMFLQRFSGLLSLLLQCSIVLLSCSSKGFIVSWSCSSKDSLSIIIAMFFQKFTVSTVMFFQRLVVSTVMFFQRLFVATVMFFQRFTES